MPEKLELVIKSRLEHCGEPHVVKPKLERLIHKLEDPSLFSIAAHDQVLTVQVPVARLILNAVLGHDPLGNLKRPRDPGRSQNGTVRRSKASVDIEDSLGVLLTLDHHGERETVGKATASDSCHQLFDLVAIHP